MWTLEDSYQVFNYTVWDNYELEDKSSMVTLSITQVEYIVFVEGVKEVIWLRGRIEELEITQERVKINCDSQSVIYLTNHEVYHERIKHININLYHISDVAELKKILVHKVPLEENDWLTKLFLRSKLKHCLDLIQYIE